MNDLELLKLLLQETKYPYFTDEQLLALLELNNNNVYLTASKLCLVKADGDKKIVVGPITIEKAGADYWINLSTQYSELGTLKEEANTNSGVYNTSLKRSDGR